ncbi:MAG: peptidylprolyl isomerase [Verrucomicrobiaceae bacterium]
MKTPFLSCLLSLCLSAVLHAQQIKAPQTLQPGTGTATPPPPSTEAIDKLAEQAQKSLYDAADKAGGNAGAKVSDSGIHHAAPPRLDNPSMWDKDAVHKIATMEVAFGGSRETIMIELFPQDAPQTVANFIDHCDSGFYNGLAFHRAIEGFLVQTGDPLTSDESAREKWGTGGEDKTIPSEIKLRHRIGAVAMARRSDKVNPQRRSNGAQFYICLGNYGSIDGKYTVFGQVVSGLDVARRISIMPVDSNDCPVARIEVKSIKVSDHKGPLQVQQTVAGDGQRYTKPDASMIGRFFRRVW